MKAAKWVIAFVLFFSSSLVMGETFSARASGQNAQKTKQLFKSVPYFVKKFNSYEGGFIISDYKITKDQETNLFSVKLDESSALTGVLNTDNSIKSLTLQTKVEYLTKEEKEELDEYGIEGDMGIERAIYAAQIIYAIYNGNEYYGSVSSKISELLSHIPMVDPGKQRVFSKKITIDGVTYSMYVSKSDVFTLKISK